MLPTCARAPLLCLLLLLAACDPSADWLSADTQLADGSQYRGQMRNGLLDGQGRLSYPDGSSYEGEFYQGQIHGFGQWQDPQGTHYQGEFKKGQFDGQGTLKKADGSQYSGEFAQHKFHGHGMLSQGQASYQGEFKHGAPHGLGVLKRADQSQYQGQFSEGLPHGSGVSIDEQGNQYSGEFEQDQFHGQGRFQSVTGDAWMGQFVHDELTGPGQFTGQDGSRYQGEFKNWRFHGNGALTLSDGSRYHGQFRRDQYHGQGVLSQADGNQISGRWHAGRRTHDEQGRALADPLDIALLEQGNLLQKALDALPASTEKPELYSLIVAGDGSQSVFMREANYVSQLLRERFAARGNISLINHRDHLAELPMATAAHLKRSVQALAQRLDDQDMLFIYLTSHGSADHQLQLHQPRLELSNLAASELADILKPLNHIHKVIVISACYSGGFIEPLKNNKTLIMTAAKNDRVSFGCSEESDFTYFGRALFAEALGETDNLERAFEIASERVAERELQDGFEPSEPQIWAPRAVIQHWRQLRQQQAEKALHGTDSNAAPN